MLKSLWPFVLGAFALGLDAYVLAGLLPSIAHGLNVSIAQAGTGVALFTIVYAISAPVLSHFTAHFPPKKMLLVGIGIFTLGNVLTLLAQSFNLYLVSRIVAGAGAGLFSPLASASAAAMFPAKQRGKALSMIMAGLSAGTALGVPVGLALNNLFNWRITMSTIVLAGVVSALGLIKFSVVLPAGRIQSLAQRIHSISTPPIVMTLLVSMLTNFASLGLYTFLSEILGARGMSGALDYFVWAWGAGGLVGAMCIGRFIDTLISPAKVIFLILIILVVTYGLLDLAPLPLALALAGCFVWGMAVWSSVPPQQHALVSYNPDAAHTSVALNASANYLGDGLGAAAGSVVLNAGKSGHFLVIAAVIVTVLSLCLHASKLKRQTSGTD